MKKRILSILLSLCMVLCLVPTAVFAEGNEDTPTQALTSVDITFPKPEEGKKIGDGKTASANADSGLNLYLFGPALWQKDGNHQELEADDTYQKDSIYLLNFTFYTQKPITDETALTCNSKTVTRYADYKELAKALNAYDGKEDAYLGFVTFSAEGTGDPSMEDLKNINVVGLYALVRAQEAQTPEDTEFSLDPGGTYYFDLSDENIPGTVNDSLPDSTLHYVPFTYVGTVNAYKLTSETAPTEEYAQKNKYPHSLFIADYNVTHTLYWNDLNDESMIFGKDYAVGGVDYTLRAPSVGSNATGSNESLRGTPLSNEWDRILDKDSGYIKNWSEMSSWGQDTLRSNASFRTIRGVHSARSWSNRTTTYSRLDVGFRPVLEVLNPDTLGSNGLKVVTLDLGGGKLGNSSEDIQIIVKNDSEFTAPASHGLTRPDGNNGSYFKWLDSDGNLYAPGDRVPADVTKLTALFYEQFNLALGGT